MLAPRTALVAVALAVVVVAACGGGDSGEPGAGSANGTGGSAGAAVAGPPGSQVWAKRFGDFEFQSAKAVAVDGQGNVLLTGEADGTVDFGGDVLVGKSWDVYLAKFDPAGNHVWSKRVGDGESQFARDVAVDGQGNVFLLMDLIGSVDLGGGPVVSAGGVDILVAKFDASGKHVWTKRFGDASYIQWGNHLATDPQGGVVIVGNFEGTVDFGGGPLTTAGNGDAFVAKLDAAGNHVWSKRFGDKDLQRAVGVSVDATGNVVVVGEFGGSIDLGGGPLVSAGGMNGFVAKLDPSGQHLWSQRLGDGGDAGAYGVGVDADGGVVLGGFFSGTLSLGSAALATKGGHDAFVAKLDAAGQHVWSKSFGDGDAQSFDAVAVAKDGSSVIGGTFKGTVDLGGGPIAAADGRGVVARLDASGNHAWSKAFGSLGIGGTFGVGLDPQGNVLIGAGCYGPADFGGGPLAIAPSDFDATLAKLSR